MANVLINSGTTYGKLYNQYPSLKGHLGANAPANDIIFNGGNAVGQMAENFIKQQISDVNSKNFVELTTTDSRLSVIRSLVIPRKDVIKSWADNNPASQLFPKEVHSYVRIAYSSDAPDRKATNGNGGYVDYSNKNYAWRVSFDVAVDTNGKDLPFTDELRDRKISMSYGSKMYDQYSILAVGDTLKLRIKTSLTHKYYETLDSLKNLIKGNDTLSRDQIIEIEELWNANSVTKNNVTFICMLAPNRESKYDLNQNNLGTPARLSGRDLVKMVRFCNTFDKKEEAKANNDLKLSIYKDSVKLREMEDDILMDKAAKLVERAARFGEVISLLDAYDRVAAQGIR